MNACIGETDCPTAVETTVPIRVGRKKMSKEALITEVEELAPGGDG